MSLKSLHSSLQGGFKWKEEWGLERVRDALYPFLWILTKTTNY